MGTQGRSVGRLLIRGWGSGSCGVGVMTMMTRLPPASPAAWAPASPVASLMSSRCCLCRTWLGSFWMCCDSWHPLAERALPAALSASLPAAVSRHRRWPVVDVVEVLPQSDVAGLCLDVLPQLALRPECRRRRRRRRCKLRWRCRRRFCKRQRRRRRRRRQRRSHVVDVVELLPMPDVAWLLHDVLPQLATASRAVLPAAVGVAAGFAGGVAAGFAGGRDGPDPVVGTDTAEFVARCSWETEQTLFQRLVVLYALFYVFASMCMFPKSAKAHRVGRGWSLAETLAQSSGRVVLVLVALLRALCRGNAV